MHGNVQCCRIRSGRSSRIEAPLGSYRSSVRTNTHLAPVCKQLRRVLLFYAETDWALQRSTTIPRKAKQSQAPAACPCEGMLSVAQAATGLYHLQLRHHADGVVEPTTPSWRTTLSVRGCSNPMVRGGSPFQSSSRAGRLQICIMKRDYKPSFGKGEGLRRGGGFWSLCFFKTLSTLPSKGIIGLLNTIAMIALDV